MEGILEALPFDISFVDENDTVKYWNKHNKRMFKRSIEALGKTVQDCHPPESVNSVNQVLTDLRNGEREVANFRTELNGRDIYIRYFPVRDTDGKYIGTLEVEQDITDM
jgi:PAS domain S-box-containing protein